MPSAISEGSHFNQIGVILSQLSNPPVEDKKDSFVHRLLSLKNPNCLEFASPLSFLFSGERAYLDEFTRAHLDRERALKFLVENVLKIKCSGHQYSNIGISTERETFFKQMIFSPLSETSALREGQAAVGALSGEENKGKRELYAALVDALDGASVDPYQYNCRNSYRVLPDSFHYFMRQLWVIGSLSEAAAILERLPPESSEALKKIPDLAERIRSLLICPFFAPLLAKIDGSKSGLSIFGSKTWSRFADFYSLALYLKRLADACESKDIKQLETTDGGVRISSLAQYCAVVELDFEISCPLTGDSSLESNQFPHLLKEVRRVLEADCSAEPLERWTPDLLNQLAPIVTPAYRAMVEFFEKAVCVLAPIVPRVSFGSLGDELAYLLGAAEACDTCWVSAPASRAELALFPYAAPGRKPSYLFPEVLDNGPTAVSLQNYRDRWILAQGQKVEDSPLTFALVKGETAAVVGGDNGFGKSTACLSVFRFFADSQSLLPINADGASFIPRTSFTAFFVESCDTRDSAEKNISHPPGSYDRFLERVKRVVYEVLPGSNRAAILFDDSIRAYTSNDAALGLIWDLLEHFCESGFLSLIVQQDPTLAQLVRDQVEYVAWTRNVTVWGTNRTEFAPGIFRYSLVPDLLPPCSGKGLQDRHGLGNEQLRRLRNVRRSEE